MRFFLFIVTWEFSVSLFPYFAQRDGRDKKLDFTQQGRKYSFWRYLWVCCSIWRWPPEHSYKFA